MLASRLNLHGLYGEITDCTGVLLPPSNAKVLVSGRESGQETGKLSVIDRTLGVGTQTCWMMLDDIGIR